MSQSVSTLLNRHWDCRAHWLETTKSGLVGDHRLEAGLLYGSFGRGDADVWSDIDIIVFVEESVLEKVAAERLTFVQQFGDPLYCLDSPWNAPVGGAQVNVLYRIASVLPLYVDWNLWPLSMAGKPAGTIPLFQRSPETLRVVDSSFDEWATFERQPAPADLDAEGTTRRHAQFGQLPIAVKFCLRRQRHRLVQLLEALGAASVPDGPEGEMLLIRQRIDTLGSGEDPAAVDAVRTMCGLAERVLGLKGSSSIWT